MATARADLIVWRPGNGTFYWLTSSSGYDYMAQNARQWGTQALGDRPMVADMDGDGRSDLVVWRASTGTWFWLTSSSGYSSSAYGEKQWGTAADGDVPLLGDVDGDGFSDLIVWRASSGTWFWLTSSSGYNYMAAGSRSWGLRRRYPGGWRLRRRWCGRSDVLAAQATARGIG